MIFIIIKKFLLKFFILILIGFNTVHTLDCLDDCTCYWAVERYEANCSNRGFELYPPNSNTELTTINIDAIDLTNNRLIDFPYQLSKITNLLFIDLTNNRIKRLKSNALIGFKKLRTLFLNNNNFSTWSDINPNTAFKDAKSLETLSLAYNPITSFSNVEETFLIMSHSIIVLDLSYCQITKLSGESMLSGLTSIERLILDGNPIKILTPLISNTLKVLDLINCNIELLKPDSLLSLTNLLHLNLSHNSGIRLKNNLDQQQYVVSETLLTLDLSNCNLNIIEIEGFSILSTLNFNQNLLNKLTGKSFENNQLLEYIDLSKNSINYIELSTFNNLKLLKKLDLSYNVISQIDSNMFIMNNLLISLNLSKNYLSRFHKIIAHTLIHLYLNSNDISKIDPDALTSLKNISILDLSNNVFSTIPINMESKTLEILDISMCRLIKITNRTFIGFPELLKLDLSGNRLTQTPKVSYFQNNRFLKEIRLHDNLWDCKCQDSDFHEFYNYYVQRRMVGSRLKETPQCGHPTNSFDNTWVQTCKSVWTPLANMGLPQKIWTIIFSAILVFTFCLCFYAGFRRCFKKIKNYFNQRALRRNINSYRETRQVNSTLLQQDGFQNAPNLVTHHMNIRESMPPCYEDALLMPKRNISKSMVELNSTSNQQRKKAKLKRTSTNVDLENENNSILDDNNRFYSEERLLDRDKERSASNVGYIRRQQYRQQLSDGSRLPQPTIINYDKKFPSSQIKSQNLQDFERIAIFKNSRTSPYSSRKWKMRDSISFASISDDSLDIHKNTRYSKKNLENIDDSLEKQKQSPYSRRRPRGMSVSQLSISRENIFDNDETQSATFMNQTAQPLSSNQKIVVVENHFNGNNPVGNNNESPTSTSNKINKKNDNINSSDFNKLSTSSLDFDKIQMPSKEQSIESLSSDLSNGGMVVVNLPVKQSKF